MGRHGNSRRIHRFYCTFSSWSETGSAEAAVQNRTEVKADDWKKELKQQIGAAIDTLAEHGLIGESSIAARKASRMNPSNKFATKEAINRLKSAGLIKVNHASALDTELSSADMVIMHLFNTEQKHFGKGMPNQKEAVQLVEQCVASYLGNLKD